ncbi:MAG: DUF4271 domain-containing protein [Chitinophagales bacterium]|nr:DUF4271 domain-containing protein [Chitinophagales bacterium]
MSIFFKKLLLVWIVACSSLTMSAKMEFSPAFQDSFVVNNSSATQIELIHSRVNGVNIIENPQWDVQQIKIKQPLHYEAFIMLSIAIIFIILKFLYPTYLKNNIESIVKFKNFETLYKSRKYTDLLPITLLFIVRSLSLTAIIFYITDSLSHTFKFSTLFEFVNLFVVINIFFLCISFLEFFTQAVLGMEQLFKPYFTQYIIITTWFWLLISLIFLILSINGFLISKTVILYISGISVTLLTLMAVYRSKKLGNDEVDINFISFILYICTFKIIPYLLILKYLSINRWML